MEAQNLQPTETKIVHEVELILIEDKWQGFFLSFYLCFWPVDNKWIWYGKKKGAFPPMVGGIAFDSLEAAVGQAKQWLLIANTEPSPEDDKERKKNRKKND